MQNVLFLLLACSGASALDQNPLGSTIQLLDELTAKITADGEAEAKAFVEYTAWCDDTAQNTRYEIKTATALKGKLEAKLDQLSSDIDVSTSKIGELAGSIAEADGELKDATTIRAKESADFAKSDAELVDTVGTLDRAINILNREMSKNPAAFAQLDTSSMNSMVQSLNAIVDAAAFSIADKNKLAALVQSQQQDDDAEPRTSRCSIQNT